MPYALREAVAAGFRSATRRKIQLPTYLSCNTRFPTSPEQHFVPRNAPCLPYLTSYLIHLIFSPLTSDVACCLLFQSALLVQPPDCGDQCVIFIELDVVDHVHQATPPSELGPTTDPLKFSSQRQAAIRRMPLAIRSHRRKTHTNDYYARIQNR
jgi:hypothetical protein